VIARRQAIAVSLDPNTIIAALRAYHAAAAAQAGDLPP